MPIVDCTGDIFLSECLWLVNPVNCGGVMGKGLAKQFKERLPHCTQPYYDACRDWKIWPGRVIPAHGLHKFVAHFPTKRRWQDPSELWYIEAGLWSLRNLLVSRRAESVAIPALGCGEGGLAWDDVRPLIVYIMSKSPFLRRVEVYGPR